MIPPVTALVAAALLAGCDRDPVAGFNDARIEAVCDFHERCGDFDAAGFKDAADCRETLASASRSSKADMTCEDFSQGEADACVAAWDTADCVTPPDLSACEAVCAN